MIARQAKLLEFLKKSPQFIIPIYQRTYSWTEKQCRQLWDDILRTGQREEVRAHFIGSIVYVEKGLYHVSSQAPLLVIDGQQRLTTATLLIEALARKVADSEPIDGFSARKLRNYYLLNPEEEHEKQFKLILSQKDKDSLIAILKGSEQPNDYSLRVTENFDLFTRWIADCNGDLAAICKGLAKLIVVDVSLDRDQDNPQLIFESMNSTGLELSQADLIRNYVLMGLEPDLQTRLYEFYWRPMEVAFGQTAYATQFDKFMRHYLTVKMGEIPNQREVYETFKQYAAPFGQDIESLVKDIRIFADHYCAIALGREKDKELRLVFQDIRELKVDTCYPLLLELYHDYHDEENQLITKDELLQAARWIESYVFRRAVCDIATNSLNKTFANFRKNLIKDRYLESIQATFLLLPSYRRFPSDEEFKQDIQKKDIYGLRSKMYFFRRLENHGRKKEPISVAEYTIEHIMPQNPDVSDEWRVELGNEWERVWQTYVHTLGNLTLTGYNSEYSDRPFAEKRDMENGFAQSTLKLNSGLGKIQQWNEDEIRNRAQRLATQSLEVWTSPKLSQEVLAEYRPKPSEGKYAIENHPRLLAEPTRSLFEALRQQILEIDPCVAEEFLKLYVAYKAETNFVDIIPQAKRLRLSLNIPYVEIDDPQGICKDITTLGRWGNGDVEVNLDSTNGIPYVMTLIRQSYEKQMGPSD